MISYPPHSRGFSLIELSIVLAIIGVTLGGALTLGTKQSEASKLKETNIKLDQIEQALEQYVTLHQRLPCPADGTSVMDAPSSNQFGIEGEASSTGCTGSNMNDGSTVYAGVVPVKTLGLPDNAMIDGWGKRISYAVDVLFANNNATNADCDGTISTACFQYTTTGRLTIQDAGGAARTTEAVYVLVSHGKNGYGAFPLQGGGRLAFPATPDTDEYENSEAEGGYDSIFIQKSPDNHFDDIVRYKPKWQLLNDANGITDPNSCIPARKVVEHPDNSGGEVENSCSGARNVTACERLATYVYHLCLQP